MADWPGDDAVFPYCMPIIKQFEGYRTAPYLDSVGVATIGYGTTYYPDGSRVTIKDPDCNDTEATAWLSFAMSQMSKQIAGALTRPATLQQAAAMLSLSYNIGAGSFKTSTVLRKFNAGDIPGAADAFLMWDKGTVDGKLVVIDGLKNRRTQERAVFLTEDG